MNLMNLVATLSLNTKAYDKGLKDAGKNASSFSSKLGTAMKAGGKAISSVVSTVKTMATAVTAATAVVSGLVVKSMDFADGIDKQSQKVGLSREAYQLWSIALQQAGADVSVLTKATRSLTDFTEKLAEGDGDALLALQELGIGYNDFMLMDNDQKLMAVVDALQGMEDQTDKVRIAQELFGKQSYQELLPLLNMEQGSVEEMFDKYRSLGLVLSDDVVDAYANTKDRITEMTTAIKVSTATIFSQFLPALDGVIESLTGIANGSENAEEDFVNAIVEMVNQVADKLPTFVEAGVRILVNIVTGIVQALPKMIPSIMEALESLLIMLIDLIPTLAETFFDIVLAIVDALFNVDWGTVLVKLIDAIFIVIIEKIPDFVYKLIDMVMNIFSVDGLKKLGDIGLKLGIGLLNGLIRGLNRQGRIKIPGLTIAGLKLWDDIDIKLFEIPLIQYANGGMLNEAMNGMGTMFALAGESGAEIVAQGSRGTGVANVEQIAEAQYEALDRYELKEAIFQATEAIVNGFAVALKNNTNDSNIVVKIGENDFKSYVIDSVNTGLKAKGRKSLDAVTGY